MLRFLSFPWFSLVFLEMSLDCSWNLPQKGLRANKFIGGVHKIPIFVRDFPKELFRNIFRKFPL